MQFFCGIWLLLQLQLTAKSMFITKLLHKYLTVLGTYIQLMGKVFSRPERLRMYSKQYIKEMTQLGVDSIGIVLLISFLLVLLSASR